MATERLEEHDSPETIEILTVEDLVLHVMRTLDLGGNPLNDNAPTEPGNNDPTYRSSAFAYGVSLAMEPLVETYKNRDGKDIQDILNRTFRLSFHYSAGSPLIQSLFQLRIARLLRDKFGEQALREAAETAIFDLSKFTIPAKHIGGRAMKRAYERTPAIWEFYKQIINNIDEPSNIAPLDRMGEAEIDDLRVFGSQAFIALGIPYFMLNREIAYLRDGRPNKTDHAKRYRSDIREHAIEEKPTGNNEFDIIFSEMGIVLSALRKLKVSQVPDFYVMTSLKQQIDELEKLWEERHALPFKSP